MGWALGRNQWGEDIGYSVPATCSIDGCDKMIDRGIGYTCGGLNGHYGDRGCGKPFCSKHLFYDLDDDSDDAHDAVCGECLDEIHAEEKEEHHARSNAA